MFTSPTQCRTPRRVLQVITPSRMSGAETQLVRMTARLEARGHAVATLVKTGSPAVPEMQRLGLNTLSGHISGKFNPAALLALAQVARQHRADLIQSTLSTASWWSGWLERFGGPPSIGHVQGFTSASWHRHQSHLLAVSHAVKRHLVKQGIPPERFTVLHNAISPDDFFATRDPSLIRAELGAEADTPVVGTFAHLSAKKGHRDLFAAIPTVLRRVPKAQFWIVGEGQLWEELHQTAQETGVMSNIRFLGFRRDVANLMNAIDVMALPSRREPCALVYVEAALSRKPSIGCRSGGARNRSPMAKPACWCQCATVPPWPKPSSRCLPTATMPSAWAVPATTAPSAPSVGTDSSTRSKASTNASSMSTQPIAARVGCHSPRRVRFPNEGLHEVLEPSVPRPHNVYQMTTTGGGCHCWPAQQC